MSVPQFGIFARGTHAHHFLEFDLRPGVTPRAAVASFWRLAAPEVSVGVNLVIAFAADLWRATGRLANRIARIPHKAQQASRMVSSWISTAMFAKADEYCLLWCAQNSNSRRLGSRTRT